MRHSAAIAARAARAMGDVGRGISELTVELAEGDSGCSSYHAGGHVDAAAVECFLLFARHPGVCEDLAGLRARLAELQRRSRAEEAAVANELYFQAERSQQDARDWARRARTLALNELRRAGAAKTEAVTKNAGNGGMSTGTTGVTKGGAAGA